jgi:hypothetical protein
MRHFHYYHSETGVFHGDSIAVNAPKMVEETARANCPTGHKIIEGTFDRLSQRVDVATGKIIDYQPPQPSPDHEWHTPSKRWRLTEAAALRQVKRQTALEEIGRLEAKQARTVREFLLGKLGSSSELLREIDEKIVALRADL